MDLEVQEALASAKVSATHYGEYASAHEAYGVLAEEMHELLDAIQAHARESVRDEAIQVAAVALRLSEVCRGSAPFADRSGFNGH